MFSIQLLMVASAKLNLHFGPIYYYNIIIMQKYQTLATKVVTLIFVKSVMYTWCSSKQKYVVVHNTTGCFVVMYQIVITCTGVGVLT